jgi:hypothetical protein
MQVNGQVQAPAGLYPGIRAPRIHCLRRRWALGIVRGGQIHMPNLTGCQTPIVSKSVTILTELHS